MFLIFGYCEHSCVCFLWTHELISLGYTPKSIVFRSAIHGVGKYLTLADVSNMVEVISLCPIMYKSSSCSRSSPKLALSV